MSGPIDAGLNDIVSGLNRMAIRGEDQEIVESEPNRAEAEFSSQASIGININIAQPIQPNLDEAGPSNLANINRSVANVQPQQNDEPPQPAQVPARDLSYLRNPHRATDYYEQFRFMDSGAFFWTGV